jgi:predicted TIM-barrel fold metal-dependent hydrolase
VKIGRRAVLARLGAAAALAALPAWAQQPGRARGLAEKLGAIGPLAPRQGQFQTSCVRAAESARLNIDVHCHIFNGADLPVRGFVQRTVLQEKGDFFVSPQRWLSQLADFVIQHTAPGTDVEMRLIDGILEGHDGLCEKWEEGYWPEPYDPEPWKPGAYRYTDPALYYTQPRLFNALAMMRMYPQVHLFTPSLVDFRHWLSDASPVVLSQQIELQEKICELTRGRVHPFVSFDPLHEVVSRMHRARYTPLELAQTAVREKGFVGIKLYPPMGFAPTNNARHACLPDWLGLTETRLEGLGLVKGLASGREKDHADLAAALDEAMFDLFDWCVAEDVPVMAHANESNYTDQACGEQKHPGGPEQWGELLAENPGYRARLRINLGHLGRMDSDLWRRKKPPYQADDIVKLMGPNAGVYTDLANWSHMEDADVQKQLAAWLDEKVFGANGGHARRRFLYGSDWHMHVNPGYFGGFDNAIRKEWQEDFFGANAADFLGLRKDGGNRKRLEKFYEKKRMGRPEWMVWVDRLPARG